MLQTFVYALLSEEADSECGADNSTRTGERTNRRNGYRHRDLDTRVGGPGRGDPEGAPVTYLPEWLLERRKRTEAPLTSVVAKCYQLGVSTRRVDKLVQALCISGLSKSQVSVMTKDLEEQVAAFRSRPLDDGQDTFVAADALMMKVREGGWVAGSRPVSTHASRVPTTLGLGSA